ncbi:MAG: SsrA-binding protein SmpB [Lachnospiraceae bacterium]|nr:SsrA-binding protein SmpB [Lachnospiraceae bacterium]
MGKENILLIANNKKAYHDFFIEEKYECGIVLYGTEIKSIRQGKVSIKEAYVSVDHGEAFVEGMNISPYEKGNIFNRDPLRKRKLLLHKAEIAKLAGAVQVKGYTLIPLQVYLKGGRCKIEVGLARGKKLYDKREDLRRKELNRESERDYKVRMK